MKTPIAFFIFSRPETTKRIFAAIRQAQPAKLFIIADGARTERLGESEKCAETRAIVEKIDWDCQVYRNYSDSNLGCGTRVSIGINWVFSQVEEAIFLEDDCLPHPHFFVFCEEMLERYRDDSSIMHVAGNHHLLRYQSQPFQYSYYFSRYPLIWGWATWRRAWQHYDFKMRNFLEAIESGWLERYLKSKREAYVWNRNFGSIYHGSNTDLKPMTWDYQWVFTCWMQAGLAIHPTVNLVSNIGFGAEATHTQDETNRWANLPVASLTFPLKHPPFVMRDEQADRYLQNTQFDPSMLNKLKMRLRETKSYSRLKKQMIG